MTDRFAIIFFSLLKNMENIRVSMQVVTHAQQADLIKLLLLIGKHQGFYAGRNTDDRQIQ